MDADPVVDLKRELTEWVGECIGPFDEKAAHERLLALARDTARRQWWAAGRDPDETERAVQEVEVERDGDAYRMTLPIAVVEIKLTVS